MPRPGSLSGAAPVTALITLSLALTACGGTPQPRRFFSLAPASPDSTQVVSPPTLRIREFQCASAYDQAGIIFRVSAVELRAYRYTTWTASPGVMMSEALRRYLAASGRFIVVDASEQAELELTGRIDVIEQLIDDGDWQGRLEMSLALRRIRDGRIFWRGRIDGIEPAEGLDVAEVVAAQSRILNRGLIDALPDIAQAAIDATVGPPAGSPE
jgi:ABC-type uncharacterized transport system auxiliary subunit